MNSPLQTSDAKLTFLLLQNLIPSLKSQTNTIVYVIRLLQTTEGAKPKLQEFATLPILNQVVKKVSNTPAIT
jgi:hypothetical protein